MDSACCPGLFHLEGELSMPVKKRGGRWYVKSYSTGKWLKRSYKTKAAAERRVKTTKRRSKRVRHTRRRRY